ncbi:MAG TPA: TatD family hydrolase [Patescibacteria group bacterium]|nr:TatD family hydrolase [Patescibacteria group bacterium]
MIELIDSHCHIQSISAKSGESNTIKLWAKSKDLSVESVIKEAKSASVYKMICVGCNQKDSHQAVEFVKDKDGCFAAVGVHPHDADKISNFDQTYNELKKLALSPKVVAIGECGLDYHYLHSTKVNQKQVFKLHLKLAQELNLPVIFHIRDAYNDFWPIVDQFKEIKGVVHSFSDSTSNLNEAIKRGYFIGVNGIATFTKDQDQLKAYKQIPLNNLLLETDAPYLTPSPYRGKINQPKYILDIAKFLCQLKEVNLEDLARQTSLNANKLFNI